MSINDKKIGAWTNPVTSLDDQPQMSSAALKQVFDSNSNQIRTAFNALIDFMQTEEFSKIVSDSETLTAIFSNKVDKETGKGLSANDFTDILKAKLDELSNYDDTAVKALITAEETARKAADGLKVDKVTGKGLSANDFTDVLKAKLENLSNYDDTAVKSLISAEATAREAADNLKVDKVSGKGLSANDFTNADKNKLESLSNYDDTEVRGLIENKVDKETGKVLSSNDFTNELKLKLDSMSSLDKIAWSNIDTITTPGTYLVTGKKDYDGTPGEGQTYSEYDSGYPILIVSIYTYYYNGQYNESGYRQLLYDANGKIMYRMDWTNSGQWSDWSEYIPTRTITQQSAISEVSSTVTTYTFNPKSSISPSAAFKINHTGTNTVTFNFGTPSNTGYTNEILVYFKTALDNAVVWGSNVKFTDDEIPTIEAGVYYRIVAEYNPIMSKWVVGIINDGKGA